MAENFQNFYVTKLREACDASATTLYVETIPTITEGTLVIEYANSTKHEIIHFTGRSGYSLTGCTRGYEGTTAQSHSAGVDVRQNVTAGMMDAITNRAIHTENIADEAVTTAKIEDEAVTSDKIDWTTFSEIYDNIVTNLGKTYTITTPGIYLAWGISSSPISGATPTVAITMAGTVKSKAVSASSGLWVSATAVAVGVLNYGDTIVVSQDQASTADNRSSVGMCLVQRI